LSQLRFHAFVQTGDRVHTFCIYYLRWLYSNYFNINSMGVHVLINIGCLRLGKKVYIPSN